MKKINQAVKAALNAVEALKHRIVMFQHVVNGVRKDSIDERFDGAVETINSRLYRKLNDAYATLFMWGNIAPEEAQREAKKAAFQHYLSERTAIMQYLNLELENPGMWFSEEEEQFRREIEEKKN